MKVLVEDAAGVPSSVAVMRMVRVAGVSASWGVPLKVRAAASKESHAGREAPSDSAALYVSESPSGSVKAGAWKVKACLSTAV